MASFGKCVVILAMAAFLVAVGVVPAPAAPSLSMLQVIDVPADMGYDTILYGMNDAGQLVGIYRDMSGRRRGLFYDLTTDTYKSLDPPGYDGTQIVVSDINNQGKMVGSFVNSAGHYNSFSYDGKEYEVFNVSLAAAGAYQHAYGINDHGHLVGSYLDSSTQAVRGFLYTDVFTPVDFPGAVTTTVVDINNQGHLTVNTSDYTLPYFRTTKCYLFDGSVFHPLPAPADQNIGYGLNDADKVVGPLWWEDNNVYGSFFYDHATKKFAELAMEGVSAGVLMDINNKDQVVGNFRYEDGQPFHGYLGVVVPVPPALLLFGTGLAALAIWRRRPGGGG